MNGTAHLFERAVHEHRHGHLDEADALYEQVLRVEPEHADALQLWGVVAHQRGDHAAALPRIARALAIDGGQATFHCNYGNVLQALGRLDDADRAYADAIRLQPKLAEAHNNRASLLLQRGRHDEAISEYRQAIRCAPDATMFRINLAAAFEALGRVDDAVAALGGAIALEPRQPQWLAMRGLLLANHGRTAEAVESLRRAAELAPDAAELHCNLGVALIETGADAEARDVLRRAIALDPSLHLAHYNLGVARLRAGEFDDALASFRTASSLNPQHAEALVNEGFILWRRGELSDAQAACERGLALNPELPEGHVTLGNVRKDLGDVDAAIAHYRRALELRPNDLVARANLIFSLHYPAASNPADISAEIGEWNVWQTMPIERMPPRTIEVRDRISIGYVSANLRTHPGGFFLGAVLAAHDRSAFKVTCYVDATEEDEHSRRIRASVDEWLPIAALSDDALADRVRSDAIDIVVDMNRFSGSCRLRAFARKPAPVQVSWMGGPITTTGLGAMDYVLSDAIHTPPGDEAAFVEEVVRLDNVYAVYDAPPYAPECAPLPAATNGFITFGCCNYLAKLQPEVIRVWAQILARVPGSRMLLQSKAFACDAASARLIDLFARNGVDASRLLLRGGVNHRDLLALYGTIDVALDPFPYSGGITTCEALWMGAPVIALLGTRANARHSVSHLLNAGLPDWIAGDAGDYVARSVALASDISALAAIRAALRDRVAASRLCDAPRFTRQLEDLYRSMFRKVLP